MPEITGKVTAIMHDTNDLKGTIAFWTSLLDLTVVQEEGSYAYLSPLSDGGPYLAFQEVPEPRASKNRLHMDIGVTDRDGFEDRVAYLGGEVLHDHKEGSFPAWTVMADPEGNEFCVYQIES
jgi:predicted enzyme related to lactoylglutathione lyase